VKDEWSINFTALNGRDGMLTLVNEQEGMNFPFFVGDMDSRTRSSFSNLDFVRVAFPKYRERLPIYSNANLELNDSTIYQLEKAQDINAIAFKTLQDRMFRELANSLLRLATKQALESFTRNQDENLGALLSIINAVTEKADTRNWQTLPHSIYYTRVSLDAGENKVNLKTTSPYGSVKNQELNFNIQKGQTTFFSFHNMESN
jgi:hypothetical protein